METFTLTTPVAPAAVTTWKVVRLYLTWETPSIYIELKGTNGERLVHRYDNAPATALMVALNKANLTTKSLQRRVIEQLATDGVLTPGTVTGTPD